MESIINSLAHAGRHPLRLFVSLTMLASLAALFLPGGLVFNARADNNYFALAVGAPLTQDWSNPALITANDNWDGVASCDGYRGDDAAAGSGVDPQTILTETASTVLDVNADQTDPNVFNTGGVTEFALADPSVALAGSGTGDFPNLDIRLNTSACASPNAVMVQYNLRDLDGSIDDAIQRVALQYRVGASGNYTNVPEAFVPDATSGPNLATLSTPVNVTLPGAASGQAQVHLRIMTSNAVGNDEWVGVDNINIQCMTGSGTPTPTPSGSPTPTPTPTVTPTPTATPTPTVTPTPTPADPNVHLTMGNPSGAVTNVVQENNYLMAKPQYALSYNRRLAEPNWVSWHLDSSWLGTAERQDDYRPDPDLPSGWYRVQDNDYSNVVNPPNYSNTRGHNCPSADRTNTVANNSAVFLMTNFLPQSAQNNNATWNNMEIALRNLLAGGSELYLIMGGSGSIGTIPQTCAPPGRCVNIPEKIWKVAVLLPSGDNDVSRVTASTRAIAVITPNNQSALSDWTQYKVSVDEVEELTGYNFFSNVPVAIQNVIESRVDGVTPASTFQLSANAYTANEGMFSDAGGNFGADVTITRNGTLAAPATVSYALRDGTALQRTDYLLGAGVINFAAGESSKTFRVTVVDDNYVEPDETLGVELTRATGGAAFNTPNLATVTITSNDVVTPPISNTINGNQFFARQHYYDFLGRLPDPAGLDYWTGELNAACGVDPACNTRRIGVSAAFFIELEFQKTGAYVYRLYRAAYGNAQPFPNPESHPDAPKIPSYAVFMPDRARINADAAVIAQSLQDLAAGFAARPEFAARYPATLTADQFVDAVLANIQTASGVNLTSQRAALITEFNAGGRGRVLYRLADDNAQMNPIDNRAFINAEFNRAFVLAQYFGYLRRDPDVAGFNFWLGVLNSQPHNFNGMVCAFITSNEYQERFSSVVTRGNNLCS